MVTDTAKGAGGCVGLTFFFLSVFVIVGIEFRAFVLNYILNPFNSFLFLRKGLAKSLKSPL